MRRVQYLVASGPLPRGRRMRHWFFNGGKPMFFPDEICVEVTDPDIDGGMPFRYPYRGDIGVSDAPPDDVTEFRKCIGIGLPDHCYSIGYAMFLDKDEEALKMRFEDAPGIEFELGVGASRDRSIVATRRFLAFVRHIVKELGEAWGSCSGRAIRRGARQTGL
ncbi:MAG: hypothetical protein LBS92_07995 [Candidatus Methanoplasma sp.]|jgi:hypothetical protein|nr:hypothetical protein [Candidatus Methanoplasma sp.]